MKALILALGLLIVCPNALAASGDFLCDLRIGEGRDEVLAVRDRPVRVSDVRNQGEFEAAFVDAFEDINPIIQKKTLAMSRFLVKAYWVTSGKEPRPEISLGLYFHNRMNPAEPRELSRATGDARTQVRLNTRLPNNTPIEFSCRNREYDI